MDKILIIDFGGQYSQLIARRIRSEHVYAEIKAFNNTNCTEIKNNGYKGIIFTGGPNSVYDEKSPHFDPLVMNIGIPILGICYGHQLMSFMGGGEIKSAKSSSEYGKTTVFFDDNPLFKDVPRESICWMSHTDFVSKVPDGFQTIAHSANCPCAAMFCQELKLFGVQFHPEVTHTVFGQQILRNFVLDICGCKTDWNMDDYSKMTIEKYKESLHGKKVLLALSGGVDSSVAAVLLNKAIGDNLVCVFVDHGLLRKDEGNFVEKTFKEQFGMNLIRINAEDRFLQKLKGITDPEEKRKIVGSEFIRVFEEEAAKLGHIDVLAQGTIYPDVVESGNGNSAVIKSHHNVGGLPNDIQFSSVVEPLKYLFKDEVREIGEKLGLPRSLVWRQPFPGPGLAVRITGEITKTKIHLVQEADAIFREEMEKAHCSMLSNQYFAVLADVKSVGVMGDYRTYGYTVVLRAVNTDDFMTAEWTRLPYEILEAASNRITNEIQGITRVVYDITSKPPATIEWL